MLKEQQQLLADVQAAEKSALKLYNAGVKIGGVVRKLRDTADELQQRVRYLEKNAPPTKAEKPKPEAKAPAATAPPAPVKTSTTVPAGQRP